MRRALLIVSALTPALALACSEEGRAGSSFGYDSFDDEAGTLDGPDTGDGDSGDGDSSGLPDLPGGTTGDGDTTTTTTTTGDGDTTTTSEEGGIPMTTDGGGTGNNEPSCSQHAANEGWGAFYCDNGNGICEGQGVLSSDCDLCCSGPSCGQYAEQQGWDWANCEWNNNGACNGQGTPTYDCEFCCGGSNNDTTTGTTTTTTTGGGINGDFGYPVGDQSSYPAGGWQVWQVMGHYWDAYGGRHLAQDIAAPGGGLATVNAPVYSVADGVVRYAGPNGSSYKNVVLIEHDDGEGGKVCSFYGHVNPASVVTGEQVSRGQQITTVRDWALCINGGSSTNTHLHYVLLSKGICDASAAANGSLICGYDNGGPNSIDTIAEEPYFYTPIADDCGLSNYPDGIISPTKFIEDHHY